MVSATTRSGVVSSLSSVLPTSQVFTSGYVNTETILHFFIISDVSIFIITAPTESDDAEELLISNLQMLF